MGEGTKALCAMLPTPTQQGQLSQHKGCTVRRGPPAGGDGLGWRVGPSNGYWVQSGSGGRQGGPARPMGTRRSQDKPGLLWPPSHVCPAGVWRGLGTTWVFSHLSLAGPSCQVRGWLCTRGVHRRCPEAGWGPEPMPSRSHLDLVILLSFSKLEGVGLHRAGHGGPAACLRWPPPFVQALPRGPSLGQRLDQLAPSTHLSVVAAALAATTACSPVPAGAHASRRTGTLPYWAGPRLGRRAQPQGYPIGALSTGWGA